MSSSASAWTWDAARQEYCYYSTADGCHIYQSGTRVYPTGQTAAAQPSTLAANTETTEQNPRYIPPANVDIARGRTNTLSSADSGTSDRYTTHNIDSLGTAFNTLAIAQESQPGNTRGQQPYSGEQQWHNPPPLHPQVHDAQARYQEELAQWQAQKAVYDQEQQRQQQAEQQRIWLAQQQAPQNLYGQSSPTTQYPQIYPQTYPPTYPQVQEQAAAPETDLEIVEDPTGKEVTDPGLFKQGGRSYKRLRMSAADSKRVLDPEYKVRTPGRSFFTFGKVIRIYWPEPGGSTLMRGDRTAVTGQWQETFFAKIRWFVVVKAGPSKTDYCSCIPIQTYNNQGVAKKNTVKSHHAIIYTGREEPKPTPDELPNTSSTPQERAMLNSIRVVPNRKTDKMDPMSRVNFAKIYTVEHNVKVYDFGEVHEKSKPLLRQQFNLVWSIKA